MRCYEFGGFVVDADNRILRRGTAELPLQPKAFELLLLLIENRGAVLSKDWLFERLWPGRVVEEANLTQTVYVLRKLLGDGFDGRSYIETLPKRGYRFAAAVAPIAAAARSSDADADGAAQAAAHCARGRHYLHRRRQHDLLQAIEHFHAATDADPLHAPAYAGLADCYALLSLYGGAGTPAETYPRAKAAALRALELDASLAEAHTALGVVHLFYEWDWAGAQQSLQRAIELNPRYPDAYFRYGTCLLVLGRFAEAEQQYEQALALDPLSQIFATFRAYPAYFARDYTRAVRMLRKTIELDPNFSMAHFRLGLALGQQGDLDGAIAELKISAELSNREKDVVAALGYLYGRGAQIVAAREALAELHQRAEREYTTAYTFAIVHLGLGETEAALDRLEHACEQRAYWLIYAAHDPHLDPLRRHPRFERLLARLKLPAAIHAAD